jgi:hypothetical protein
MNLGRWEWAIGEIIILPLLFFELYRLRRSQRRDREAAAWDAATGETATGETATGETATGETATGDAGVRATPEAHRTCIARDTAFLQGDEGDERRRRGCRVIPCVSCAVLGRPRDFTA